MDTCVSSFPYPAGSFFYVGFQAHSHNLGRLISAYVVNDAQVFRRKLATTGFSPIKI